jgi:hypothetical protein
MPETTDDLLLALERYGAAVESSIEPVTHDPDLVVLAFREPYRRGALPLILTVAAALLLGLFIGRFSRDDPTIKTLSPPPVTQPGDLPLAGPRWVLQTSDGRTLYPGRAAPFLIFGDPVPDTDIRIFGKEYCRSFQSSFRADGNVLHLRDLAGEANECQPPAGMAPIRPTLPDGDTTYDIHGSTLTLTFAGHTLVYLATEASREGENPLAAMPAGLAVERMDAGVRGLVTYDEVTRCVGVDGRPTVWPEGTTWQADPPAVVLRTGRVIPVGATIEASGGEVPSATLGPTIAEVLRHCWSSPAGQNVLLVQGEFTFGMPNVPSQATTTLPS